jgi:hypothetical protein
MSRMMGGGRWQALRHLIGGRVQRDVRRWRNEDCVNLVWAGPKTCWAGLWVGDVVGRLYKFVGTLDGWVCVCVGVCVWGVWMGRDGDHQHGK